MIPGSDGVGDPAAQGKGGPSWARRPHIGTDMTELNIAAPLAAALAAKGYESLTPVQEAVLAPELIGRDNSDWLFEPGASDDLAERMRRVLDPSSIDEVNAAAGRIVSLRVSPDEGV